MYLPLSTIDIWSSNGQFFSCVVSAPANHLLQEGDTIALGAYCPSQRLIFELQAIGASQDDDGRIYRTFFEINRDVYPDGRAFEISATPSNLELLALEAERADGQTDKEVFFDHLVAYRRGVPTIPLLSFHDAFNGGDLDVSGFYEEWDLQEFATALGISFLRERTQKIIQTFFDNRRQTPQSRKQPHNLEHTRAKPLTADAHPSRRHPSPAPALPRSLRH